MQQEANPRTLIFALLLTTLMFSCMAHSHNLAISPSPSAAIGMPKPNVPRSKRVVKKRMRGSLPATCYSKCNQCEPCMPVQVSVRSAMGLEENEYYPQVAWMNMVGATFPDFSCSAAKSTKLAT